MASQEDNSFIVISDRATNKDSGNFMAAANAGNLRSVGGIGGGGLVQTQSVSMSQSAAYSSSSTASSTVRSSGMVPMSSLTPTPYHSVPMPAPAPAPVFPGRPMFGVGRSGSLPPLISRITNRSPARQFDPYNSGTDDELMQLNKENFSQQFAAESQMAYYKGIEKKARTQFNPSPADNTASSGTACEVGKRPRDQSNPISLDSKRVRTPISFTTDEEDALAGELSEIEASTGRISRKTENHSRSATKSYHSSTTSINQQQMQHQYQVQQNQRQQYQAQQQQFQQPLQQPPRPPSQNRCIELIAPLPTFLRFSEGQPARLEIEVFGSPAPVVTWYKDGSAIRHAPPTIEIGSVGSIHSLKMQEIFTEDSGEYKVLIVSPFGKLETTCNVKVEGILTKNTSLRARSDSPHRRKSEHLRIEQHQQQQQLIQESQFSQSSSTKTFHTEQRTLSSSANQTQQQQQQTRSVVAQQREGSRENVSVVQGAPRFMRSLQNLQFEQGEMALIQCMALGTPDTVAKWYRNNTLIESSENYTMAYDYQTGFCSLSIGAAAPEDSGQYTCVVSNYAGTESSSCMIVVRGVVELAPTPAPTERRQSVIRVGRSRQDLRQTTPLRLGHIESSQVESMFSQQTEQAYQQQQSLQVTQSHQISQQRVQQQTQQTSVIRQIQTPAPAQAPTPAPALTPAPAPVQIAKPVLVDQLQDVQAAETTSALLECRLRGLNLKIQWFKGNHEIINARNRKTSYDEVTGVARLFIANVSKEDVGDYTCQATNELGGVSNTARLTLIRPQGLQQLTVPVSHVPAPSPVPIVITPAVAEPEASTAQPESAPEPVAASEQVNVPEPEPSRSQTAEPPRLQIVEPPRPQTAEPTVRVNPSLNKNLISQIQSHFDEELEGPPKVLQHLNEVQLVEGETIILKAVIAGNPFPRCTWFKDEKPLVLSQRHFVYEESKKLRGLKIINSKAADAGVYSLVIDNLYGRDDSVTEVILFSKNKEIEKEIYPPFFVEHLRINQSVPEGQDAVLSCAWGGNAPTQIQWQKDGKLIEGYEVETQNNQCRLLIKGARKADSGLYTCIISNEAGANISKSQVSILIPEPTVQLLRSLPTELKAKAGEDFRIPVAFRTALSYETKWYSDEVLLVSNEKHVIINANESTTLVIKSVDVKDQHEYKVVITNAKETFTYKTYLHVTVNEQKTVQPPKQVQISQTPQPVRKPVPHTPPSVIKPRPTSAPEDKALLRVPRPEIIEQILKPKPSVSPVMKDHNDFETLKPQSPAPPVDQHIKISIRAPKPQFEMQLKDLYHYKVGEQVKLRTVLSKQVIGPVFRWYSNGELIQTSWAGRTQIVNEGTHVSSLIINNSTENDSAFYECAVVTAKGRQLMKTSTVVNIGNRMVDRTAIEAKIEAETKAKEAAYAALRHKPVIEEKPQGKKPVIVQVSDIPKDLSKDMNIQIEAIVEGDPKPKVTWLINAREVNQRDGFKAVNPKEPNCNKYVMNITKINPAFTGILTIKASNEFGQAQRQIFLNIHDAPKILNKLANSFVKEGRYAEFSCKFRCNPLANKITWYKNETEEVIENDNNLVISMLAQAESETILRILKPDPNDNGANFTVRIRNDLGEAISAKGFMNISNPPVFVVDPTDKGTLKEREVRFECVVKGNPRPMVSWFFGETELTNRDLSRLEEDKSKNMFSLTLPRVLPSHVGTYKVVAVNEYGMAEKTCNLKIIELPKIISELENLQINEKESAKFSVKVSGADRPPYKWFRDGNAIVPDDNFEVSEKNDVITLLIKSCVPRNAGNYYLKFVADYTDLESNRAQLLVNRAPRFIEFPKNSVAVLDQAARVECVVDSFPKAKLQYFINGKEITVKDHGIKLESDAKTGKNVLIIPKVDSFYMGKYLVKASNIVDSVECNFELDILEDPKILGKLDNVTVGENNEAKFTVKLAKGKPKPTCKWFREEKEIDFSKSESYEATETDNTYSLTIKSAQIPDAGWFNAKLTNEAGSVNSNKASLTVKSVPKIENQVDDIIVNADESKTAKFLVRKTNVPVKVEWLKNGKAFPIDNTKFVAAHNEAEYSFSLAISNIAIKDAGKYTITVSNAYGVATADFRLLVRSQPTIVNSLKDIEAVEGTKLELPVRVSDCFPLPTSTWSKNDQAFVADDGHLIEVNKSDHKIVVANVTDSDAGKYTFKTENELGSAESTTQVTVLVKPTFLKQLEEKITRNLNTTFQWAFELKSKPAAAFKIFKDAKEVKASDRLLVEKSESSETSYSLTIKNVIGDDAGLYKIEAKNKAGSSSSNDAELVVSGAACIIKKPNAHVFLAEKKSTKIEFEVAGIPLPEAQWFKNGQPLKDEPRFKTEARKGQHFLLIDSALLEDTAEFTFKAKNDSGEISETFNLVIQTPPVILKALEPSLSFKKGEDFILETSYSGFPVPTATWSKDRNPLAESDRVIVTTEATGLNQTTSKLTVKNLVNEDTGAYQATMRNTLGSVSTQSKISVSALPQFNKELSLSTCSQPVIESQTEQYNVLSINEKAQIRIEGQINAKPTPVIKWFKDDVELKASDRMKIEVKLDLYLLTIKHFSADDVGLYRIQAENTAGVLVSKLYLDINTLPVIVQGLATDEVTLKESNQKYEFIGTFKSKPKSDVFWFFNDKPINADDSRYVVTDEASPEQHVYNVKFQIQDLKAEDSGTYKFRCKNCVGEAFSQGTLQVNKGQVFVDQLAPAVEISEKNELKLVCKINDSNPKSTISWFKDGTELKDGRHVSIPAATVDDQKITTLSLIIKDSNGLDTGLYTVKSVSKVATIESNSEVTILSAPKITKEMKPQIQCPSGAQLSLEVNAIGKPEPEFKWYRLNNEVESEVTLNEADFRKNKDVYTLTIDKLSHQLKGKYTIKITNSLGSAETSCLIIMDDAPVILKDSTDVTVVEGADSLISVTVDSSPAPTFEWFKNGVKLKTDKRIVAKVENNVYSLIIYGTKLTDVGKYTACFKNKIGQTENKGAVVGVSLPPAVIKALKDTDCLEGIPFDYSCEIAGNPKPEVTWFMDETQIEENNENYGFSIGYNNISNNNIYKLTLKSPNDSNNKCYKAVLKSELGTCETKGTITVLIPPRFLKTLEEKTEGLYTSNCELVTQLCAKPAAKFKVLKDNKEIKETKGNDHYKFETEKVDENTVNFKVVIHNVQATDAGVYRIDATNKCLTVSTTTQFFVKGEPTFIRKPADLAVAVKKQATFYCEAVGCPIPTVTWFKDGNLIERSDNLQIEAKGKGINSMVIRSVSNEDEGIYLVKAKNESGEIEHSFRLTIDVPPILITPLLEKIEVLLGHPIKLECAIGGSAPTITWDKKGEELVTSQEKGIEVINDGKNQVLSFASCRKEDAGIYSILAQNKLGKVQSKAELIVKYAPKFKRTAKDTEVIEKRNTKLEVEITGCPKPTVTWYKDGIELELNDRIIANDAKGGVYQLLIKNSKNDDTGKYTCKAVNKIGQIECSADLDIESAPNFTKKLEKLNAVEDCEAEWYFQLTGIPKPDIEITRDNLVVDIANNPDLYAFEELENKKYCIRFKKVCKNDVGTWRINAKNQAGTATTLNKLETSPLVPPMIIKGLAKTQLAQAIDNRIEILVSGNPFPKCAWFKDGNTIDLDGVKFKQEVDGENGVIRLVIFNSQVDVDSGLYKAVISNPGGECSTDGVYTIKGFPPKFVEKPEKRYVLHGSKATFAASADGDPMPMIKWIKNGVTLEESEEMDVYYDETNDTHFLEIFEAKSKDAGQYKCVASNIFGSETVPVILNVTHNKEEVPHFEDIKIKLRSRPARKIVQEEVGPDWGTLKKAGPRYQADKDKWELPKLKHWEKPFQFKAPLKDRKVVRNSRVQLQTIINTNYKEAFAFKWKKNDVVIDLDANKEKYEYIAEGTVYRLVINDFVEDDEGSYEIYLAEPDNMDISSKAKVVIVEDKFASRLENQFVKEGEPANFECKVNADNSEVQWLHNDQLIVPSDKLIVTEYDDVRSLMIDNCKPADSGTITCKIGDKDKTSAKLNVEPTLELVKGFDKQIVMETHEIRIECKFNRPPKFKDVCWYRNGKPFTQEDDSRVEYVDDGKVQCLVIQKAKLSDAANYSIKVEEVEATGSLKVKELPLDFTRKLDEFYTDIEKGTVTLECEINKENTKCIWKRYGRGEIIVPDNKFRIESEGRIQRLIVSNLELDDQQNIACIALKNNEEIVSTSGRIIVNYGPLEIVRGLEDMTLQEDSDAIFTVELNREHQSVDWYKDDVLIKNGLQRRMYSVDKTYTLRLNQVNPIDHNATYTFKVKDLESSGVLTVIEKPIKVVSPLNDKVTVENKTVRLEVEFNKPDIEHRLIWLRNDQVIDLSNEEVQENIKLRANGTIYQLVIKKPQFEDEGRYTVKVRDSNATSSANLSVTEGPVEIVTHLKDTEVKETQSARFEVELNKSNVPLTWFFNGTPITKSDKNASFIEDGKIYALVLKKCDPNHIGRYSVKTPGPASSASLFIEELPVEFERELKDVTVKEKETAVFTCEMNKENAQVEWYRGFVQLEEDDKKYRFLTNGNKYSMEILNAQLADMTEYAIGLRGKRWTANLKVEEIPVNILRPLQDVTVHEKNEIVLECEFELPNLVAVWYKDDLDVKHALDSERCYPKVSGTVHRLTIMDAKLDDFGKYSCLAKLSKTTCKVQVLEAPAKVVKPMSNQEVVEKQTAVFDCTLSKSRLKVAWYRNEIKLSEDDRIHFAQEGKVYKLIINNAQLEDKTTYRIKYEEYGVVAESTAQLNVREAPNKIKTTLADKEAVEEDEQAFFEIELMKPIKENDDIKWTFNGKRAVKGTKYAILSNGNKSRLTIRNIRLEDEGTYAVEINNSSSSATLVVNELPVKFVKQLSNLKGKEDESVTFKCEISKDQWKKKEKGNKPITVRWFKAQKEIKESPRHLFKSNGVQHSLTISELEFDDISDYSAVLSEEEKTTAKLVVNERDVAITTGLNDIVITEKETAQFECQLNKLESVSGEVYPVTWFKRSEGAKEKKIAKDDRIEIISKNKKLFLKINDAIPEDSGVYSVTIGDLRTQARLTVNEIPTVFKSPLKDQKAREGESATFEFTVNRGDKPVKWFVNGEAANTKSGKYTVSQGKTTFSFTINDLDLLNDDECVVSCQVGDKLKAKAKLRVIEDDIRLVERLADVGAKETTTVKFQCKLNKTKYRNRPNEPLSVKWFIKGEEIQNDPRFTAGQEDTLLTLEIKSLSYQDAGVVKCKINDSITTSAKLSVEEEPVVFVQKLTDVKCTKIPGQVIFECMLNKPFSEVAWFKNGVELPRNEKYVASQDRKVHTLTINDVDGKDVGEYTILLQGKYEKTCSSTLSVRSAPAIHLSKEYTECVVIKRGQPLELNVNYLGYPEPKATWFANEKELSEDNRIKIETIKNTQASLLVTKTTLNDSGKYVLILENECGRDKCTISVKVLDRPGPPRNLEVTNISAHNMDLSWKKPLNDGGSPITGYFIEIKERDSEYWSELGKASTKDLSYAATKLKLGKFYSYRVTAKNKYGESDPVETEEFEAKYPFTVPDAPINCMVTDVTAKKCSISFYAPLFNGGSPILGYFVERRDTSTNKWVRLNRELFSQLNVECNDLVEGTEYEFRITAENLAGPGLPSQPCQPFTAKNPYERPSPPINVKCGTVTKSSIDLSWDKPLSNGGSAILGYRIEKRNPKTLNWSHVENVGCPFATLDNLREGAEYDFRVIAYNIAGDSDPSSPTGPIVTKEVILGEKPTLLEPLKDLKVLVGESATFVARIKAKPRPEIKWTANERAIGEEHFPTYSNDTLELTLNNVQLKDEGVYKVRVKNALGELTLDAKLVVLKAPSIKYDSRFDRTIEVVAKENLNISCEVHGVPKPTIQWFKDRLEIVKGGPVSRAIPSHGEYIARLDLESVARNEGGRYSIRAENEVGATEATFTVKVLDVPMPPQNLKCTDVSATSCTLTWQAPVDDGNVPVTGYYIEKYDSKRNQYIRIDKTSVREITIDRLQKDQSYKFRVLAENKIGLSEPCELKDAVLAKGKFDVPGAPQSVEASEITDTSCRISWESPVTDGGAPIKGYYVERKCATRWLRLNPDDPETRKFMNVKDLIQGMDYEFRVCAVNSEGEGPFSKPSDSFTAKNKYDKPDVPIYVDVRDITKSSCVVTWSPPTRTGGLPIVRYHIEMRVKGEDKFFRFSDDFISETEYEVTGLAENQEYEFRIVAENKRGISLPSEPARIIKAKEVVPGVLPQITLSPEAGNLIGSQGKIQATVTGTPTPDIKWKKGSRVLSTSSSKYSISFAQSVAILYINNLTEDDTGTYTIEVENSEGGDQKSCKFSVYSPPSIEYSASVRKSTVISAGSNFRIACQVTGCPKPAVVWSKDDSVFDGSQKAQVDNPTDNQHYLSIKQCDRNDTGSYVIKASNPSGNDEAKFDLKVVDKPDQPRGPLDISLDPTQGTKVTLEWFPPKWDGGSELIGYLIEFAKIEDPTYSKSLEWFRAGYVRPNVKFFSVDNLTKNSYYFFRVSAENNIGLSEPLASEQALHARPTFNVPGIPKGPLLIKNIVSNGCTLKWGMPADDGGSRVHSFVVEAREKRRATWHQVDLVDASETKLKVHRLIENNSYYFRVSAKNNVGVGEPLYSDRPVVIVRPPGAPDSPFPLLVTEIQSDNCTLEWKAPTWTGGEELKGYLLEVRIGDSRSGQWMKVANVDAMTKTYKVRNLNEGEEYYFRISAYNDIGVSEPLLLNRAVVPKKKLSPPSAPDGPIIATDCDKTSITIQWDESKDNGGAKIQRYIIFCREVNTANWNRVGVVDYTQLYYQINKLTENSYYHFRVVAENNVGQSDYLQTTRPLKARSPYYVPESPEGPIVITNVTDSTAIISWRKSLDDGGSPITGYVIKRRDLRIPVWVTCGQVNADTLSFKIKDLVEGFEYGVQVFAENSEGLSIPLESDEPIYPSRPLGPPSEPSNFECIGVDANQITVLWEAPYHDGGDSVKAYQLEIAEKSNEKLRWMIVDDEIDPINTSYVIRNLIEGQKYFVRISAINDNGIGSPKTLDKSITPCRIGQSPSQPIGPLKILNVENDSITVGWTAPENDGGTPIAYYIVDVRDVNKASWKYMATVDGTLCQYQINNLVENNEYFVRVKARNEARLTSSPLESANPIMVRGPYTVASEPKNLKLISTGRDNAIIEFTGSDEDGGCEIYRYIVEKKDSNRVTWIKARKVKASLEKSAVYRCEIFDLNPGSTYCVRVSAENRMGRSLPCVANALIVIEPEREHPSKPFDLNIYHNTPTSIVLKWNAPLYNGNDSLNEYVVEEWSSLTQGWRIKTHCEPNITSCIISNLADDLTYKYRVRAVNSKGASEPSLETFEYQTLKQQSAPSNPRGPLRAVISDDQSTITLHWLKPKHNGGSPLRRYIIERLHYRSFMTSNEWYIVGYTSGEETTFKITEYLIEDSSFSFRVIAENDIGKSIPLELLYPLTLDRKQKIPESPSHLRYTDKTATTVDLVWKCFSTDSLSSAAKYRIEKKDTKSNEWTKVGYSKSERVTVYDLDPELVYHFRVTAINSAGESQPSETHEPISMDITKDVPSKPFQIYAEQVTHNSVSLAWLNPSHSGSKPIIGYKIYQLVINDPENPNWEEIGSFAKTKSVFEEVFKVEGLYNKYVYKFRVCAYNEIGIGRPNETDRINLKKYHEDNEDN